MEKPPHTFRLGLGTLFQYYMPKIKKIMTTPLAEEEVEKLDYSRIASRNIK